MPEAPAAEILEAFDNPDPARTYWITFDCPEFTCVCPITRQPDFARLTITYAPDKRCVELKSLKLYLMSFRNTGTFHEAVVNRMVDDLAALLSPRVLEIVGVFNVRGGIQTTVTAHHGDRDLLRLLR
ncbi:MAG: preQ(1) synthase [Cyanobacteria bacterium REEB65]|nr:preQ(1) synthase [Cyanobacteria bacterium REEB65]